MSRWSLWAVGWTALALGSACDAGGTDASAPGDGAPSSDAAGAAMSAKAFCELVYEAPKRQLESTCSAGDKKTDIYARLVSHASRPVAECAAALEPSVSAGRLRLNEAVAKRCAKAIAATGWKRALATRDLSLYPECAGLAEGTVAAGGACRLSADCQQGLWCLGGAKDTDGVCRKQGVAGEKCVSTDLLWLGEREASCAASYRCKDPRTSRQYNTALPITPALSKEERTRRDALRGGSKLGMKGLLTEPMEAGAQPKTDCSGSQGFGGHGRLGRGHRKKPPQLRMAGEKVQGSLPPEVVRRIVRANFGRFRHCYQKALDKDPKLTGRMTVSFVIDVQGTTKAVTVSGDLEREGVQKCVADAFKALTFPRPESGVVRVEFPIRFIPPEAPATSSSADANLPDLASSPFQCIALTAKGDPCELSVECAGGLVCRDAKCQTPGKAGDPCDCANHCDTGLRCGMPEKWEGKLVCQPAAAEGEPCTSAFRCKGACEKGQCIPFCSD